MAARKNAEEKPEAKKTTVAKDAAAEKPVTKKTTRAAGKAVEKTAEKPAEKKTPARRAAKKAEVIVQSPLGGEITTEEILAKVGAAEKIYVRVDQNKAYWVRGEETGSVDLW